MTDPFDALAQPILPVDPDPGFARRLRDRLERGFHHSRQIRNLQPHHGMFQTDDPLNMMLCFAVRDVDEAAGRVVEAGGWRGDADDRPYGRLVDCRDDQDMSFALFTPPGGVTEGNRGWPGRTPDGNVVYMTIHTVDSARFRVFFGSILGWQFRPGRIDDGWQLESDVFPLGGMSGGHDRAAAFPMYQVSDVEATVARVREAGGTATDPVVEPYGMTSDCVDDQGSPFYLGNV